MTDLQSVRRAPQTRRHAVPPPRGGAAVAAAAPFAASRGSAVTSFPPAHSGAFRTARSSFRGSAYGRARGSERTGEQLASEQAKERGVAAALWQKPAPRGGEATRTLHFASDKSASCARKRRSPARGAAAGTGIDLSNRVQQIFYGVSSVCGELLDQLALPRGGGDFRKSSSSPPAFFAFSPLFCSWESIWKGWGEPGRPEKERASEAMNGCFVSPVLEKDCKWLERRAERRR